MIKITVAPAGIIAGLYSTPSELHYLGVMGDWCTNQEDAIASCIKDRDHKVKLLKKRVQKLQDEINLLESASLDVGSSERL
jgi:hypothetical protein